MSWLPYEIDGNRKRVRVVLHHAPTVEEAAELLQELASDPAYAPQFGILVDRQHAPASKTESTQRIVRLCDAAHRNNGPSHWAVVVSDMESFGMGRMAEQLTTYEGSIRVFRSMAEAEQWLDSVLG